MIFCAFTEQALHQLISSSPSMLSNCWWCLSHFSGKLHLGKLRWLRGSHCPTLGCRSWPAWPLGLSCPELLGSSPLNSSLQSLAPTPSPSPCSWRNNDRQQGSQARVQSWVHPRKQPGSVLSHPLSPPDGPRDSSSNMADFQWFCHWHPRVLSCRLLWHLTPLSCRWRSC